VTAPDAPRATDAPSRRRWRDLGPRVVSGLVLLGITIAGLYLGGYIFAALVGAVFAGCYREWDRMVTLKPLTMVGGVLIGLLAAGAVLYPLWGWLPMVLAVAAGVVLAFATDRETAGWRAGGLIFFGLVIVSAIAMRSTSFEGALTGVFLGFVIWMTDTGAFFTGRQIGGEKLAPDISPGKTWSGAIGGFALGTLAGLVVWLIIAPASPWWIGLILATLLSLLGQVGDLSESAIKRRFRVKDSGDIIPGHGGLMDRLDSLTFGLIFVFAVGLARAGIGDIPGGFLNW
jgi:phosphatidate cytidylyltransferase